MEYRRISKNQYRNDRNYVDDDGNGGDDKVHSVHDDGVHYVYDLCFDWLATYR